MKILLEKLFRKSYLKEVNPFLPIGSIRQAGCRFCITDCQGLNEIKNEEKKFIDQ
jgi:hypothetical protein